MAVYSKKDSEKSIHIPQNWGEVKKISKSEITASGEIFVKDISVEKNQFILRLVRRKPVLIRVKE